MKCSRFRDSNTHTHTQSLSLNFRGPEVQLLEIENFPGSQMISISWIMTEVDGTVAADK